MTPDDDPLGTARGCFYGVTVSVLLMAVLGWWLS